MKSIALIICVLLATGTFAQKLSRTDQAKLNGPKPHLTNDISEFTAFRKSPDKNYCFWYTKPAKFWSQALPFGNGRIGGMAYGGIKKELVTLNENTIWGGAPILRTKTSSKDALVKAREFLFNNQYSEADKILEENLISKPNLMSSYQLLGLLELNMDFDGEVTNYRRDLDLETALTSVQYKVNDINYKREVFASVSDDVIVVKITADKPGSISFDMSVSRDRKNDSSENISTSENNKLIMTGQAVNKARKDHAIDYGYTDDNLPTLKGVKYETHYLIVPKNGQVKTVKDSKSGYKLSASNCDEAVIYISAATNYNKNNPLLPLTDDLSGKCLKHLKNAEQKGYSSVYENSVEAHKKVFNRVDIQLGDDTKKHLPTDERIAAVSDATPDTGLESLQYQYGRYLLMCSVRPGGQTMGLQGIWAGGTFLPWLGDYHININQQMNYWGAESGNLSEYHEPFFDLTENLVPNGREYATNILGCRGFTAGHTTDPYFYVSSNGKLKYSMWVVGGAWCSRHFMEHYYYTGDKEFLRNRAYPLLKDCALFFLDWLVEDPTSGKLVSGPTASPENLFFKEGSKTNNQVCMGPAMDQEIIWETFTHYLETVNDLDITDEITDSVKMALENLKLPQIGKDGRIQEWTDESFLEQDPGHRHMSHIYGLFPSRQFNQKDSPEYFAAARKSIEHRLSSKGGQTGWSRAWIINFWARLQDGEKAHENLIVALKNHAFENMFNVNPPFQIDGNFGNSSGIAEMLLQSHLDEVHLLPAIPKVWDKGSVMGLCARGGFEVEMSWVDGKIIDGKVLSKLGKECTLRYKGKLISFNTEKGKTYALKELLEL